MKRILFLSSALLLAVCANSFATTSEYAIDDVAVETYLNSSIEVAPLALLANDEADANAMPATTNGMPNAIVEGKDATTAFLLEIGRASCRERV